ncbi:lipopolysaccharide assembly protein LapA domain-containing protein [Spirochaeta africana]|uniref:Lipopolysaccharide assembly protein A domain-containing protein n=1 Tax=Spirochaeta africana (strain ATCC 700263 / DSM 8902 / Z-7692) TaxID=889378 RepID=H9UJH9_SPIAZ|nr:lipopolysaccharide assembly protein LapA domain-containing protein [Spirochaeta africana]AFG37672.1 hypothetical protein Spiaf_1614 [Spirochaeta africana DSM 8902]
MPWRLILFILLLVLIMFFVGYNLDNRSDISVVFYTFQDVPVFFAMFGSFLVGVIIMLPFALGSPFKKKQKTPKQKGRNADTHNEQRSEKAAQQ